MKTPKATIEAALKVFDEMRHMSDKEFERLVEEYADINREHADINRAKALTYAFQEHE
jgi:adenylate kinase